LWSEQGLDAAVYRSFVSVYLRFRSDRSAAELRKDWYSAPMKEILIRFLIGGVVVCIFSVLGDFFKPKSFAGIFGAAPSVALATITLTVVKEGRAYAAVEAHSMIVGAVAFFVYARLVSRLLLEGKWSALLVTVSALSIWCVCAFGLWLVFLR
jgi:hypothetical protein